MIQLRPCRPIHIPLCLVMMLANAHGALAADSNQSIARQDWAGVWHTREPGFSVRIILNGESFRIHPLQPATLDWRSYPGPINHDTATVGVEYQGVKAQVMVQLTGPDTAMVRTLACEPDFHVICNLASNQEARFIKSDPE